MRTREVVVSGDAALDIERAVRFYDGQERGLGGYFASSILADLESLGFFAGIHPLRQGHHRMLAKRFPFALYYDVTDDEVTVLAVLDMRSSPSAIQGRLGSE